LCPLDKYVFVLASERDANIFQALSICNRKISEKKKKKVGMKEYSGIVI